MCWLVDDPPERVRRFWEGHYEGIASRALKVQQVASAGYRLLDDFVLPEREWWDDYYTLIDERLEGLRKERTDPVWQDVIAAYDEELHVVREGLGAFGYVFFVMERDDA